MLRNNFLYTVDMPATEQGNMASTEEGCKYYTSTKFWYEMKEKTMTYT